MKKILCEKFQRVTKNRVKLEKCLNVKIENQGKEITIDGEAEDEFVAEKVIDALDFGFPFSVAVSIKEQDYMFEIINIKDYTKRKDLRVIRARIIGTEGKTLKTLGILTKCYLELNDNLLGVIGEPEYIRTAQEAIFSLIRGSKQANVYSYLEKHQPEAIFDLGLKEPKKKRKK